MTTTTKGAPVMYLTKGDIRKLRDARIVLVKLGIRADAAYFGSNDENLAYRVGLVKHAADAAEAAVFDAMSTAKHHLDADIPEAMLHGVYSDARKRKDGGESA